MGVHQRIDRLAHKALSERIAKKVHFPTIPQVIHFEGLNGPDGIKRKSPSQDEPWHHVNPDDPNDTGLYDLIEDHIHNLTAALQAANTERASFEAAWLAHAVTDGLTPAHHDDLSGKIEDLWGKAHHERDSVKDKAWIRGVNRRDMLRKNWEYWGKGGIFTKHFMFEWGVATSIMSLKFDDTLVSGDDFIRLEAHGFKAVFYEALQKIAAMRMYDEFGKKGWNRHLATETRRVLIPEIVKAVTLAWYQAVIDMEKTPRARTTY